MVSSFLIDFVDILLSDIKMLFQKLRKPNDAKESWDKKIVTVKIEIGRVFTLTLVCLRMLNSLWYLVYLAAHYVAGLM